MSKDEELNDSLKMDSGVVRNINGRVNATGYAGNSGKESIPDAIKSTPAHDSQNITAPEYIPELPPRRGKSVNMAQTIGQFDESGYDFLVTREREGEPYENINSIAPEEYAPELPLKSRESVNVAQTISQSSENEYDVLVTRERVGEPYVKVSSIVQEEYVPELRQKSGRKVEEVQAKENLSQHMNTSSIVLPKIGNQSKSRILRNSDSKGLTGSRKDKFDESKDIYSQPKKKLSALTTAAKNLYGRFSSAFTKNQPQSESAKISNDGDFYLGMNTSHMSAQRGFITKDGNLELAKALGTRSEIGYAESALYAERLVELRKQGKVERAESDGSRLKQISGSVKIDESINSSRPSSRTFSYSNEVSDSIFSGILSPANVMKQIKLDKDNEVDSTKTFKRSKGKSKRNKDKNLLLAQSSMISDLFHKIYQHVKEKIEMFKELGLDPSPSLLEVRDISSKMRDPEFLRESINSVEIAPPLPPRNYSPDELVDEKHIYADEELAYADEELAYADEELAYADENPIYEELPNIKGLGSEAGERTGIYGELGSRMDATQEILNEGGVDLVPPALPARNQNLRDGNSRFLRGNPNSEASAPSLPPKDHNMETSSLGRAGAAKSLFVSIIADTVVEIFDFIANKLGRSKSYTIGTDLAEEDSPNLLTMNSVDNVDNIPDRGRTLFLKNNKIEISGGDVLWDCINTVIDDSIFDKVSSMREAKPKQQNKDIKSGSYAQVHKAHKKGQEDSVSKISDRKKSLVTSSGEAIEGCDSQSLRGKIDEIVSRTSDDDMYCKSESNYSSHRNSIDSVRSSDSSGSWQQKVKSGVEGAISR